MANLVSPPNTNDLTESQVARAEALVAAHLDMTSLQEQTQRESGEVGSSGLIHLRAPATGNLNLTLASAPAAGILDNPRVLNVKALTRHTSNTWGSVPRSTYYSVTYTSGWTAENLPSQIREAVLLTAQLGAAAEDNTGIKSESMGPVSVTYADTATSGTLPGDAAMLLKPWLPLRF